MNKRKYWLCGAIGLVLAGPVPAAVSVVITPSGSFTITPGVAVINQTIASIRLNADVNYQLTLRDDNGGLLKNGVDSMSYTVKYNNGTELTLSTTPYSVETGATVTNGDRALTVFVPANVSVGVPAGNYTATITVEILAV